MATATSMQRLPPTDAQKEFLTRYVLGEELAVSETASRE
jgi:hypothetical protein